jgi:chromosomal replication initiation ATPase DnaA
LKAVCQSYGCSAEELRAPEKVRPFTEARAVASAIIQGLPHLSLTEPGKELNRDIAPLGRVGRRIENKAAEDERLRGVLESVKKKAKRMAERLA